MSEISIKSIVESLPYKIKDIKLSDDGRKALEIAEKEMPGLMQTRKNNKLSNIEEDISKYLVWHLFKTIFFIKFIPFSPMSSNLPTKGEIKDAPALAANKACETEKQRVTFTIVPCSLSLIQVFRPSIVSGTFTVTFFAREAR